MADLDEDGPDLSFGLPLSYINHIILLKLFCPKGATETDRGARPIETSFMGWGFTAHLSGKGKYGTLTAKVLLNVHHHWILNRHCPTSSYNYFHLEKW